MRRDALRALGALCGQRPLQRALIEGEGLPPSLLQICAAAAHVAEQKAALLACFASPCRTRARARRYHVALARARAAEPLQSRMPRGAGVANVPRRRLESTLDAGQPPRDSWASLAEAEERGVAAAAAARSAIAVQALAASRAAAAAAADGGAEENGGGRRRPSGRARSGAGGRGARDEGGGSLRTAGPLDGGAALSTTLVFAPTTMVMKR